MPPKARKSTKPRKAHKKRAKPTKSAKPAKQKKAAKAVVVPKEPEVRFVPVDTLNRSKCLEQGKIQGQARGLIGQGGFGQIYEFCEGKDCKYVLKLQMLAREEPQWAYLTETFLHSYVQKHQRMPIVPKLYDYWTCIDDIDAEFAVGCMIMDKWEGNLAGQRFTPEEIDKMEQIFKAWIPELVRLKIVHNDAFGRNILRRGRGANIKLALTDWGNGYIELDPAKVRKFYETSLIQATVDNFRFGHEIR